MQQDPSQKDSSGIYDDTLAITAAIIEGDLGSLKILINKANKNALIQYIKRMQILSIAIACIDQVPRDSGKLKESEEKISSSDVKSSFKPEVISLKEKIARRLEIFHYLLNKIIELDPNLLDLYNELGYTTLHLAMIYRRFDVVKELLKANVDLKDPAGPDENSTMIFAKKRLSPEEFAQFQKIVEERGIKIANPKNSSVGSAEIVFEGLKHRKSYLAEKKDEQEVDDGKYLSALKAEGNLEQKESDLDIDKSRLAKKLRDEVSTFSWLMSFFGIGRKYHDDEGDNKVLDEADTEPLISEKNK